MARGLELKNPIRELNLFRTRAIIGVLFTIVLLSILATRMFYLQMVQHDHYNTLSDNNRVNIQPIAPIRGLIYDRNGVVLAQNLPTFSLEVIPEKVEDLEQTVAEIQQMIAVSEADLERFERELEHRRRFEAIPLRFRLSEEEVAQLTVNRHRLPGVEITSRLTRHYPMAKLTAHTVGYVGRINEAELKKLDASNYSATNRIGKLGVEKSHETMLHGKVGFQQVETNARGRVLRTLESTPPQPGVDLQLNLDINLQRVATAAFGEERGALVAIDPRDGGVLAMVSVPSYDSNSFVDGIHAKAYNALLSAQGRPLFNRALHGQYPPGSTTKPFIGLAGLELGVQRKKEKVVCPGYYMLENDDRRYRDWKRTGHGPVDVEDAIIESCDVFFYDLSLRLGIDRISSYMTQFSFGSDTGIDIASEASGLMPSREWKRRVRNEPWFPGETLITGIGQGFMLATPLQLANSTATLAMNGAGYVPHLVQTIKQPDQAEPDPIAAQPLPPVPIKDQSNWDHIHKAMVSVVHAWNGTARGISNDLKYKIAGKTGTAQVFGIKQDEEYVAEDIAKRLRDHALFIGYAPADKPTIAVAVVVENGGSGGAVAAPIARKVMDAFIVGGK